MKAFIFIPHRAFLARRRVKPPSYVSIVILRLECQPTTEMKIKFPLHRLYSLHKPVSQSAMRVSPYCLHVVKTNQSVGICHCRESLYVVHTRGWRRENKV